MRSENLVGASLLTSHNNITHHNLFNKGMLWNRKPVYFNLNIKTLNWVGIEGKIESFPTRKSIALADAR